MTTLIDIEAEVERIYGISNFRTSSIAGWIDTQSLVFEDWPKTGEISSLKAVGKLPKIPFLDNQEIEINFDLTFTKVDKTLVNILTSYPPDGINLSIPRLSSLQIKDLQLALTSRMTELDMDADSGEPILFDILSASFGCTICLDKWSIPIVISFPIGDSTEWTLEGNFESFTLASGLSELAQLVGGDASWLDALPPQIAQLGHFSFHDVRMTFDPTVPSVSLISLEIASTNPLEIIPEKLALEDPRIFINIANPTDSAQRSVQGSFSGMVQIGGEDGVGLYLSADVPDMRFYGALVEGSSINFTKLLGQLLPEVPLQDAPNVELHDFNLRVDASDSDAKTFSIYARCYSDWEIIPGLMFTCVQTAVDYDSKNGVGATLISVFNVGGVDVTLSAAHPKGDGGWQFEGSTGAGQEILIGELIEDLVGKFSAASPALPAPLEGLVVKDLSVSFNTKSKDFKFTCKADLPVSEASTLETELVIEVKHEDGVYTLKLSGQFDIMTGAATLTFNLQFEHGKTDMLIATYSHGTESQSLKISDLLLAVTAGDGKFTTLIETLDITIDLKDVLFAFYKKSATKQEGEEPKPKPKPAKFLFGLDIGAGISLTNLPLVGQELPEVSVDNLQILIATQPFETSEVKAINEKLAENVTKLPLEEKTESGQPEGEGSEPSQDDSGETSPALAQGVTLSASLKLGTETRTLLLSPSGGLSSGGNGTQGQEGTGEQKGITVITGQPRDLDAPAPAAPSVKWIQIQKSFGPVRLGRIGFQYENQVAWFLLDASFSAAGVTLSLIGLRVGSSISKFEPQFDLQGLGIAFKKDQVEISGAFLKQTIEGQTEYLGKAIIRTEVLSLSAIGGYADISGQPSIFIYAVLDYPLGGPPVFFVTGLAAGFGYNRALRMPTIDQVEQFPLIAAARSENPPAVDLSNLSNELAKMSDYIPPQLGQYFLAAGVKFTSFKMIDSFAMLAVSFGQYLEICVLGLSTIKIPFSDNLPCLSEIVVAIKASYVPAQGFLAVVAQLTPSSYILSKNCHLTGGLAFYTWFNDEHPGDFALTVGGYHPGFVVPAHYPQVPPLAINWQVNECLNIKGNAYLALTPSVLMAGAFLEANWRSGPIEAWFRAKVDFLIAWKPFYYDATVFVGMGVAYTFTISTWFGSWSHRLSAELGTNLHIWGPEFSGVAHIQVSFISFDIAFGWSNPSRASIGWEEFEGSLLPADILNVSVRNGLKTESNTESRADESQTEDNDLGVIDPNNFMLVVDSAVPIRELNSSVATYSVGDTQVPGTSFGIAPMNLPELYTAMTITITRDGQTELCTDEFELSSTPKNVPAGVWGTKFQPDLNSDPLVKNVISGFKITAKPPAAAMPAAKSTPVGLQAAGARDASGRVARRARKKERSQLKLKEKELDLHWEQDLLLKKGRLMRGKTRRQKMLAALGFEGEVSR